MRNVVFIRIFVFLTFFLFQNPVNLFANKVGKFNLTSEMPVKITVLDDYRSGRSQLGERVTYKIEENVRDQRGNIMIKKGVKAYGTVLKSRCAGSCGRRGILEISVEYTTAVDGRKIDLMVNKDKNGEEKRGIVVAGAAFLTCPLFFIRGANVVIKSGTSFTVYVDDGLKINMDSAYADSSAHKLKKQITFYVDKKITMNNGTKIFCSIIENQDGIYTVKTQKGILNIKESDVKSIEPAGKAKWRSQLEKIRSNN